MKKILVGGSLIIFTAFLALILLHRLLPVFFTSYTCEDDIAQMSYSMDFSKYPIPEDASCERKKEILLESCAYTLSWLKNKYNVPQDQFLGEGCENQVDFLLERRT